MCVKCRPMSRARDAILVEQLREKDEALRTAREALHGAQLEIRLLRQKLDALARRMFGRSSERLDAAQLQLLLEGLEEIAGAQVDTRLADTPATQDEGDEVKAISSRECGPRVPEHLPVREIIIEPEEVKACPDQWKCIGEEVTEQLDYTPGSFTRLRIVRRKYAHRENRHEPPVIAPLRPSLQERCLAAPSLLAHAFVSRYRDHLPWYRIENIYAGLGVSISRQNLGNWSGMAADAVQLVIKAVGHSVFADGYVQIDETPVEYLSPGNGQTKTGYLWVAHNPQRGEVLFQWHASRATACLESLVPDDFAGIIQCDGYSAYDSFARSNEHRRKLLLAGCWAHARRKFFEAKEHTPDAAWALTQIQALYRIEEQLREARAGPDARKNTRQAHSRPLIEGLRQRLTQLQHSHTHRPQSLMGRATGYVLNQWESLLVFLDDGRLEIDNNLVENTIRPSAIGKKNWLFVGDAKAGDRAATFYTLIGNCRREGVDAFAYLKDLFTRLPSMTNHQVKDLTPKAWAKQQHENKVLS
jgi:transposase